MKTEFFVFFFFNISLSFFFSLRLKLIGRLGKNASIALTFRNYKPQPVVKRCYQVGHHKVKGVRGAQTKMNVSYQCGKTCF